MVMGWGWQDMGRRKGRAGLHDILFCYLMIQWTLRNERDFFKKKYGASKHAVIQVMNNDTL